LLKTPVNDNNSVNTIQAGKRTDYVAKEVN
jgi:hypothetical protein